MEFEGRCQALFADLLGHGNRWKSACAHALGIGRATFYRYLQAPDGIPALVLERLDSLERSQRPLPTDESLLRHLARALVDIQRQTDDEGSLRTGLPSTVRRAFDLGSARNFADGKANWPVDLASLGAVLEQPLYRWVPDLTWDADGEFTTARFVIDGSISSECVRLAAIGEDPEAELAENAGYRKLLEICHASGDAAVVYSAWRRLVVRHPVLVSWGAALADHPELALVPGVEALIEQFYHPIPESFAIRGRVPTCPVSRTIVRAATREARSFFTEYRDPEAVERARVGDVTFIDYRPGMLHLRRPFRMFWCLPGISELALETRMKAEGWACEMWPRLDRVDLTATSKDGRRRIAVDVKDYLSPAVLAARFVGFKEFTSTHACFLVVPDYVSATQPQFASRFEALRESFGRRAISIFTVSGLLAELGAA